MTLCLDKVIVLALLQRIDNAGQQLISKSFTFAPQMIDATLNNLASDQSDPRVSLFDSHQAYICKCIYIYI